MRGGQALANVHSKQGILAQGDVKLEELWQAEVKQGPPKHPRRNFLVHAPPDLQAARVYAAVAACPRTWSKGERNCIICDCGLRLSESTDNHCSSEKITCCRKIQNQIPWLLLGLRSTVVCVRPQFMSKRMSLIRGCGMQNDAFVGRACRTADFVVWAKKTRPSAIELQGHSFPEQTR